MNKYNYILKTFSEAYPEGCLIYRDKNGHFWHGGNCKIAVFHNYYDVREAVRKIRHLAKKNNYKWYPDRYQTFRIEG